MIVLHHDDRNDDVTSDGVHEDDNTIAIIKQLVILYQLKYKYKMIRSFHLIHNITKDQFDNTIINSITTTIRISTH